MKKEILRMNHVYVGESPPYALDNFRLTIYEGEMTNLIGFSGAGKTLLLDYFNGRLSIDRGTVTFDGQVFGGGRRFSPNQKIICIGRETSLVDKMTVEENIFVLSRKKKGSLFLNRRNVRYRARLLLSEYAPDIAPDALVEELTALEKYIVAFLRAIENEALLVVIDDVFQSLGYREIVKVRQIIAELKKRNIAVLYEGHMSDFLLRAADRIVIMRKGMNIRTFYPEDYDEQLANRMLLGNEPPVPPPKTSHRQQEVCMHLDNFIWGNHTAGFSIQAHRGEILGFYDQENKANRELAYALTGESDTVRGAVEIDGKEYCPSGLERAIRHNIGFISKEMSDAGVIDSMSFVDNLFLPVMKKTSRYKILNDQSVWQYLAGEYMEKLGITERDQEKTVRHFDAYIRNSILLTRWSLFRPSVLICIEPCARADMRMKHIVYEALSEIAAQGCAVLISAPDLQELIPVCDTVYIYNGKTFEKSHI